MSEHDDWQAAQHQDECVRMQLTMEALAAAEAAGTPKDALIVLAYEAGVGAIYNNKEATR